MSNNNYIICMYEQDYSINSDVLVMATRAKTSMCYCTCRDMYLSPGIYFQLFSILYRTENEMLRKTFSYIRKKELA